MKHFIRKNGQKIIKFTMALEFLIIVLISAFLLKKSVAIALIFLVIGMIVFFAIYNLLNMLSDILDSINNK